LGYHALHFSEILYLAVNLCVQSVAIESQATQLVLAYLAVNSCVQSVARES